MLRSARDGMDGQFHSTIALPPRKGPGTGLVEGWASPRLGLNLLKPNDIYICRTAALTSRRYILNIYSTNIHTEYFKHVA